jgi:hypothetical protein
MIEAFALSLAAAALSEGSEPPSRPDERSWAWSTWWRMLQAVEHKFSTYKRKRSKEQAIQLQSKGKLPNQWRFDTTYVQDIQEGSQRTRTHKAKYRVVPSLQDSVTLEYTKEAILSKLSLLGTPTLEFNEEGAIEPSHGMLELKPYGFCIEPCYPKQYRKNKGLPRKIEWSVTVTVTTGEGYWSPPDQDVQELGPYSNTKEMTEGLLQECVRDTMENIDEQWSSADEHYLQEGGKPIPTYQFVKSGIGRLFWPSIEVVPNLIQDVLGNQNVDFLIPGIAEVRYGYLDKTDPLTGTKYRVPSYRILDPKTKAVLQEDTGQMQPSHVLWLLLDHKMQQLPHSFDLDL